MEFFKLPLKQLTGGDVAEYLAGHIVHLGGSMVAVCLCDFAQGFALGEEAADDAVVAFVAPTFAGGIWVAVVDRP